MDTPRGEGMLEFLVVVVLTPHEGGQLVLRQDEKEWIIDFTDKFSNSEHPSVATSPFIATLSTKSCPSVSSDFRVTLMCNLYRTPAESSTWSIPIPQDLKLKQALQVVDQ
ncbi:hypothetical protein JVU11DRAFT_3125 [Chiua virens]|nr:hypothetical protein JVU11DRAFT_3125 [Chiua virens]